MVAPPDDLEKLFLEAAQSWDLERIYADIERVNGKHLKPAERACLRGLLCRYRPGQIAFKLTWTSGSLRVELNKGLYRYLEALAEKPLNTLRWECIGDWLEEKGYKLSGTSLNRIDRSTLTSRPGLTDWGDAPEAPVFFGRKEELAQLEQWIVVDRCHLVAIWGMGGIGKTALCVKLVEQIQGKFDYFIWRSLRHVQPIQQILADLLKSLAPQLSTSQFEVSDLIEVFKQHRCLIVLDDFETILRDGELVGLYRPGCEGYAELLERVGGERHQSCLVPISREQPKEIAVLQGADLPVRSFKLSGMQRPEARQLLVARGFTGSENGMEQLVQQYRGNPAALKIVGTTIHELFNGNISEFLKQTALALGDVLRSLLYQQFERLSDLEKDILYWLSIRRRPASLVMLRDDTKSIASGSELLDALESLRWRSLIEKSTEGNEVVFMLEPVVMKYVSKKFIDEVCKEVDAIAQTQSLVKIRLLRSHALVEDLAPDNTRAAQIRLILKPVKDRLGIALAQVGMTEEAFNEVLATLQTRFSQDSMYLEANLALLGLLL